MEVKVNGQIIELGNSMPAITKKSVDINNPSARFVDFTNKFNLPYTNENAAKFEHPNLIGSSSRGLDKQYNVTIFDIFELFRGKGMLTEVDKDTIALQIIDNSKDLFNDLNAKINTVSWDDLDTTLTTAQIDALDTYDVDKIWFWGKTCLHQYALQVNTDQTTGDARCKYSRPSLNVDAILKRAIVAAGYSFTASDLNLALSCWHTNFYFTSYQKTFSTTYNPAGTLAITALNTNDFEQGVTTASTTIAIGTAKTIFRLRGTITSDAIVSLIIRATDDVDGTRITESKLNIGIGTNTVDFSTSEFQSDNGMTIDVRLEGTGAVTIDALLYTILSDKDFDLSTNPFLNYKIKAYDNLPDLTFSDLFRLICVLGNKYHSIDTYNKTFSFDSLANLNKLKAVDWSDKFIIGSEKVSNEGKNLAKKNFLKYENDQTVNSELGWSYFETDNENLSDEKDYIKLNFGASNDVTINSVDLSHVKIYSDSTRIADQEIKPRVFVISGSALIFEPLKWENLVESYYSNWFQSLYQPRIITGEFDLSKLDVLSWQEKQLVYIEYFKTVFIVLEISNFIPGRTTRVKLMRYGR